VSLRRIAAIGVVLAIVGAALVVWLLPSAGRFLVEADPPERADAIVVLAGSYPDRMLEAVQLYKDGLAPRILISREPDTAGFRRVAQLGVAVPRPYEINRMVGEHLGVPADAIEVLPHTGDSTFAEAQTVLAEVLRRGYTSLVVVTSKYHTRRAGAIYRFLAGGRVRITVQPARDDDFRVEGWWRDRTSTRRLIVEYEKWLNFLLLERWGVSAGAQPTPAP
jgi:uncharacterized SAM-binding protein YcdF (DUF218 family)